MSQNENLAATDQEIFEEEQSNISPKYDDSCSVDSDNWNEANLNGLTFTDYDKISTAVEKLKNIIYYSLFQRGSKNEVHDPNVNSRYLDYIAKTGNSVLDHIRNNTQLQVVPISNKPEIESSVKAFYTVFQDSFAKMQTAGERSLCHDFLKLHLKCFPYCQREECLSMD